MDLPAWLLNFFVFDNVTVDIVSRIIGIYYKHIKDREHLPLGPAHRPDFALCRLAKKGQQPDTLPPYPCIFAASWAGAL